VIVLQRRIDARGWRAEWKRLKDDLDELEELTVQSTGGRFVIRSQTPGAAGRALQAAGVALGVGDPAGRAYGRGGAAGGTIESATVNDPATPPPPHDGGGVVPSAADSTVSLCTTRASSFKAVEDEPDLSLDLPDFTVWRKLRNPEHPRGMFRAGVGEIGILVVAGARRFLLQTACACSGGRRALYCGSRTQADIPQLSRRIAARRSGNGK
jgi:hypothetical protein